MKWAILLLVVCCGLAATFNGAKRAGFYDGDTCPGVSGAPTFASTVTNRSATGVSSISITNNTVAACPRVHFVFLDHYKVGGVTVTITNSLNIPGTLVTNSLFIDSDAGAQMEVYFWTNSTMTWAKATFSATVDNVDVCMMQLANSATGSIISGTKQVRNDSSAPLTNIITSDTTSLVISFAAADINGGVLAPILAPNMTLRSSDFPSAGTYTNVVTTSVGAASVTNWVNTVLNYDGTGLISFSSKGYP